MDRDETQTPETGTFDETTLDVLDGYSQEELLEFAKAQALETHKANQALTEQRKNSEKWALKLLNEKKELESKVIDETKIDELVQQKLDKQYVTQTLSTVKSQLSDDELAEFEAEFNDITEGKSLTTENVDKYVQKALKLANKSESKQVVAMSQSSSKARASSAVQAEARKSEAKEFAKQRGL